MRKTTQKEDKRQGIDKNENRDMIEAVAALAKEKNISKDVMLEAIENSLLSACKNHFGTSDNIKIVMDRNTCDYSVYAER